MYCLSPYCVFFQETDADELRNTFFVSFQNRSVLNTIYKYSCISANCCKRSSLLSSTYSLFHIYYWTVSVSGRLLHKNSPNNAHCSDKDTALWRKLSKCSTSTDQPGSLLNIVAYMQHTDWNNPLCPLWVVLDFYNVPEKKDGGHLSELSFLALKWWGNSSAGSLMYSKCDGWVELLSYARLSALCNSGILWHVA